jgi:hypothetical protein
VILASDVFHSGADVETLLFGSLLVIDASDVAWAAAAGAAVIAGTLLLGHRWTVTGFDPSAARAPGRPLDALRRRPPGARRARRDRGLVGHRRPSGHGAPRRSGGYDAPGVRAPAHLAGGDRRPRGARGGRRAVALVQFDAPPGAAIAVLSGAVFAAVAAGRALLASRRAPALATAAVAVALIVAGCGTAAARARPVRSTWLPPPRR